MRFAILFINHHGECRNSRRHLWLENADFIAARTRGLFEEIREGLIAYRDQSGNLPRCEIFEPDVKAIRKQFGLSQSQMAASLNVSKRTLENWEQQRRGPTGPAQTLLRIMEREPRAVLRVLRA